MAKFLYATKGGMGMVSSQMQQVRGTIRFVMISDTHGQHRSVELPEGDVLVHAGDMLLRDRGMSDPLQRGLEVLHDFATWIGEQKSSKGFRTAVAISGNHDTTSADLGPANVRAVLGPHVQYLVDSEVAIPGTDIRVYGTPWHLPNSSRSTNTSFQPFERDSAALAAAYDRIPTGADVVVTHGPPTGLGKKSGSAACGVLEAALRRVQPLLAVHGHNHHGAGVSSLGDTTVVNACLLDGMFDMRHLPVVFDVTPEALAARRAAVGEGSVREER